MFKTHLMFGFLLGLFAVSNFSVKNQILFVLLVLFFSIFPDIDDYRSKISRKLGIFRYVIKIFFKHRNFIHSIFIPAIIFLVFVLINQFYLGIAAVLGYSSHLFLDMLTKQGIMLFYPLTRKRIKGIFGVNGIVDYSLFFAFLMFSVYLLIKGL